MKHHQYERNSLFLGLLFLVLMTIACGGNKHVQGIVRDPFGNAIDSVSVQVVKSTFSALTNKKGEYSVDYVPGTFAIKFSKPGYTTQNMELTIQQKMRFPADTVIMYPIPKSQGIFLIGEKELIELQPSRVASSQMQISWMSMRYSYSASELGNLMIKPGRLRFIDKIPRPIKFAKLGYSNLIQEFDTELGRKFTYNGIIENEETEKIGEEKLLIRAITVEPGYYAWVEMVQSFMGPRPNEQGFCYPITVAITGQATTQAGPAKTGSQVNKQSSQTDITSPEEFGAELFESLKSDDFDRLLKLAFRDEDWAVAAESGIPGIPDKAKRNELMMELPNQFKSDFDSYRSYFEIGRTTYIDGQQITLNSIEYVGFIPLKEKVISPRVRRYDDSHLLIRINGSLQHKIKIDKIWVMDGKWRLWELL